MDEKKPSQVEAALQEARGNRLVTFGGKPLWVKKVTVKTTNRLAEPIELEPARITGTDGADTGR